MISPRNSTLGEEIYREIDKNEYLHELYDAILNNYSVKLLNLPQEDISILDCPKESVKNEVADIQFNVPELFIEDWMT